jgi:hypothetical protein
MIGGQALCVFLLFAQTPDAGNRNVSTIIDQGRFPYRVHVIEDYETEIERRWWLRGEPETKNLPSSRTSSWPNQRACRATETMDFDRKMGDQSKKYKAVIFNPVPGPPMGKHSRLSFDYWLDGTDQLRVQIYSLTNNYHRHLLLTGLKQNQWQSATVDMTKARRPDGSGGPLSEDERIDDIQFYIAPDADLVIDNIVLYDAATKEETRPFPRRLIFTGWFDTGKQGNEWPGDFEIVLHEKPLTWDAAKSVVNPDTGKPWLRVSMRGMRPLGKSTHLRFRYQLTGAQEISVSLVNSKTKKQWNAEITEAVQDSWTEVTCNFPLPAQSLADEVQFLLPNTGSLLVDDLLLYED